MVDYLRCQIPERVFENDRSTDIGKECGGYRPDVRYEACVINDIAYVTIVECDEHQHNSHPADCEMARMLQIAQAYRMRVRFIRWNPDAFEIDGKPRRVRIQTRLNALKREVERAFSEPPASAVEIVYMYYNGAERRVDLPELPSGF